MRIFTCLTIALSSFVVQAVHAQINTAKPVGALEGRASVSPDGTATYTVPVTLPRGVAGFTPSLSLVYSSRVNDGLAGWGWNLGGLGAITRGGTTKYYNGLVAPVKMNANDNFYLEGQLLMPVTGANGGNGTVYKTESENYAKIQSFGGSNGNPQWWRVTNKDGSTIDYGVAANDRLTATANFAWFISNAKDVNNNTITYTYGKQGNEVFISGISYSNVTVSFEYGIKQNRNVAFVYGEGFPSTKLLTNVVVKLNNIRQINYKLTHAVKTKRHYLQSVEMVGTDNSSSLLSSFNYGNPDNEEKISLLPGTYQNSFTNVTLSPGDYDGDGKTDLVVAERRGNVNGDGSGLESTTSGGYNVITNVRVRPNGSIEPSKFELTHRFTPTTYMKADEFTSPFNYYTTDFNGNGKDGIFRPKKIVHRFPDNRGSLHEDGMNYTDSIFIENFYKSGTSMSVSSQYIRLPASGGLTYNFYLKESNSFVQGDFDGDSRIDVISILGYKFQTGTTGSIFRRIPVYDYNYKGFFTNLGAGYTHSEILGIDNAFKDAQAIYPIDFDGDGKQELLVFKKTNYQVYSIDAISATTGYSFKVTQLYSSSNFGYATYKRVLAGDFNGDRKTDIIGIYASQTATILYSKGNAYVRGTFQLDRKPDFSTVWFDFFTTGDFNGDGIHDLFHYYNYPVTSGGTTTYYPKQSVHYFKGMTYSPSYTYTGEAFYCSNDDIPYDNYTILAVYPNSCDDPYTGGTTDGYVIEYTYTNPESVVPYFTKAAGYYSGMVANMVYGSPPETGDFNGDGKTEIIQATSGNNYVLVDAFGSDKNSGLLQSVTDGLGRTISFTYRSMAEKTTDNVYSNTGQVALHYPLNLMPLPIKVVAKKTAPNGTGGTTSIVYRYQDAVLDRHKGFLGFRKSISIKNNELYETNESSVNTQYRVMVPQKITNSYRESSTSAEQVLNTVQTTTSVLPLSNASTRYYAFNRFKLRTLNTLQINGLSGAAVKKEFTCDSVDNIIQEINQTGYLSGMAVVPVETATSTTEYTKTGKALVPIFPVRVVVSNAKNGQTATKIITSTYTADKGLPATKTTWAETPLASTETYTYNSFGNLTQTVISVPGKPAVTTTTGYDATQRFAITHTASCNNITTTASTSYHPFWGVALSKTEGDGTPGTLTTTYEYNALGKLIKTTTPLGHQVQESDVWDVSGQQTWYHFIDYPDGAGADQKIWYDRLGRVVKTQTLGWNNKWHTQTKTYDSRGRESVVSDPYFEGEPVKTTTTTYDRFSRIASVTRPSGTNTFTYSYPGSGQTVVVEVNAAGQTSSKKTDAAGHTIETTDHGGAVTYTHDARGNVLTVAINGITMVTNRYDNYGRKTESTEPNAGAMTYEYDAAGNLVKQTNANGKITTMAYDALNRIISRTTQEGAITYEYYNTATNKSVKKVYNANHSQEAVYDDYGRVVQKLETITGEGAFNTLFEYNANNKLAATVYPDGTRVENQYNNAGLLSKVIANGATLYEAVEYDGEGHVTQYRLVNGLQSTNTYSQGKPARYFTPGVQNLNFNFELSTGNLLSRTDAIKNITEVFTYDNLNRLTSATVNTVQQFGITYEGSTSQSNGNITEKTDMGAYTYLNRKPHAVGYISPLANTTLANEPVATVSYTSFQRPAQIVKGSHTLNLFYGIHDERVKTVQQGNGITETRLYLGYYEKQTKTNGTPNHIVYVAGGNGLCAMIVNGVPHAVYADYLGNLLTVTNSSGAVVAQQNFDAWGRRRNANDWTYNNVNEASLPAWLYRGYTGHEHLPAFNLINMNARLYDPYNGRMLSPDNITTGMWGTQGYNKYSYALNNPLTYVDATGDLPVLAWVIIGVGAIMGGHSGYQIAEAKGYDWADWQTFGYVLGGAVIGGGTAYLGVTMPAAGFSYFQTAIVTSHISNVGWLIMTEGQSDISYGYGPFTYNITQKDFSVHWGPVEYNLSEDDWDYLGERGSSWQSNVKFALRTAKLINKHRHSLFAVDPDKTDAGKAWQITSRFTWEAPQTILGMIAYDFYTALGGKVTHYNNGITFIKSSRLMSGAFTMGHVVIYGEGMNDALPHEYGHTIQSRILGPFYIPFIAIPSLYSATLNTVMNGVAGMMNHPPFAFHENMTWEIWADDNMHRYYK